MTKPGSVIDPTLSADLTEDGRDVNKPNLQTALQAAKDDIIANQVWTDTVDPTVNDDLLAGHRVGSFWLNTTTPALFQCTSALQANANWVTVGASVASTAEAQAATDNTKMITPLRVDQYADANVVKLGLPALATPDLNGEFVLDASNAWQRIIAVEAVTFVIAEDAAANLLWRVWCFASSVDAEIENGSGTMFVNGADNGGSADLIDGVQAYFRVASNAGGTAPQVHATGVAGDSVTALGDVFGQGSASGFGIVPVTRGAGSSQPIVADSGTHITTDGAITIPNSAIGSGFFTCTLEVGANTHDITHNSITLDISVEGFSAGEIYSVICKSASAIRVQGPAGTFTEADFS